MPNPNPYLNPNPNAQWGCLPDAYANQTSHYTTCAGLEQGGRAVATPVAALEGVATLKGRARL